MNIIGAARQAAVLSRELAHRVLGTVGLAQSDDRIVADAQAYWESPSSSHRWRSDSHWRGSSVFDGTDLWDRVGAHHLELFDRMSRLVGPERPLGTVLEWGCGGGANAVAFAPRCAAFVGVDISRDSIDECAAQMAASTDTPFQGVVVDVSEPEAALTHLTGPCDLFLCVYVFELITSQEYGARLLRIAHSALIPGGLAFVQIKYGTGSFWTRSRRRSYRTALADMTTYRIDEFWQLAESCGFRPEGVHLMPHTDLDHNYAYFLLSKPE